MAGNKAGITVEYRDFKADNIHRIAEEMINSPVQAENVAALGKKLTEAGGINTLISNI